MTGAGEACTMAGVCDASLSNEGDGEAAVCRSSNLRNCWGVEDMVSSDVAGDR